MKAEFSSNYKKNNLFCLPLVLMEISCIHLLALGQISRSQAVWANAGLVRKRAATEVGLELGGLKFESSVRCELQPTLHACVGFLT